jgi:hypothetical protein
MKHLSDFSRFLNENENTAADLELIKPYWELAKKYVDEPLLMDAPITQPKGYDELYFTTIRKGNTMVGPYAQPIYDMVKVKNGAVIFIRDIDDNDEETSISVEEYEKLLKAND